MKSNYRLIVILALSALVITSIVGISFAAAKATDDKVAANNPIYQCGLSLGQSFGKMHDLVADILGMSDEDLLTARRDGKSFADLAEDKGQDPDKVLDEIIAERKTQLDAKVKDGTITQEEADSILERMREQIEDRFNSTEFYGGGGGCGYGTTQNKGGGNGANYGYGGGMMGSY